MTVDLSQERKSCTDCLNRHKRYYKDLLSNNPCLVTSSISLVTEDLRLISSKILSLSLRAEKVMHASFT